MSEGESLDQGRSVQENAGVGRGRKQTSRYKSIETCRLGDLAEKETTIMHAAAEVTALGLKEVGLYPAAERAH